MSRSGYAEPMVAWIIGAVRLLIVLASRHRSLALENLALRQQLAVYRRTRPKPMMRWADRLFWMGLRAAWRDWKSALVVVRPATVVAWHRRGLAWYWTRRWRPRGGRRGPVPRFDAWSGRWLSRTHFYEDSACQALSLATVMLYSAHVGAGFRRLRLPAQTPSEHASHARANNHPSSRSAVRPSELAADKSGPARCPATYFYPCGLKSQHHINLRDSRKSQPRKRAAPSVGRLDKPAD